MTVRKFLAPMVAAVAFFSMESAAQTVESAPAYSYADLADLADSAPVVIDAQIREAIRIKDPTAANVPAGMWRFYIKADVLALIRGTEGSPSRIDYIVDVPLNARGKPPKLKKSRVLLLARPVVGKPESLQLIAPDAQLAWSESLDTRIRGVLAELVARDSPPRIAGIGNAFHTPGAIPGEGETQIFLNTEHGDPVSLLVLRRPGQEPRWAVALGEIVDEAARPPRRESLLWYRLACTLPARIPDHSLESADPAAADIARADYQIVREGLGRCDRTRGKAAQSLPR